MSEFEREFNWDDEIEKDSEFILLPAGEYNFTVKSMERKRYQPGPKSKMPVCNQAALTIVVHSLEHGDIEMPHNLFLHSRTEGLLSNFFMGIGQKKKGEKLKMNWQTVIGAKGKCNLIIRKYMTQGGVERESNQIDTFVDPETYGGIQTLFQQQGFTQQGFKPGSF